MEEVPILLREDHNDVSCEGTQGEHLMLHEWVGQMYNFWTHPSLEILKVPPQILPKIVQLGGDWTHS